MGIYNPAKTYPSFNPSVESVIFDDFPYSSLVGTIINSTNAWQFAQVSGSAQNINDTVGATGIIALRCGGAGAGDHASMAMLSSQFFGPPPSASFKFSCRNSIAALADHEQRIGIMDTGTTAGEPTNGIYFRSVGVGNWFAVCRNGGVETATNTTIAQSTTFRTYRIEINAAGTGVVFYINDVSRATITTNLPAAGVVLGMAAKNDHTANIAVDDFQIDYMYQSVILLTR